ncbi:hypothetical protein BZZ01_06380 [Nostocales cyanobacterium HT-58-2]|nr:hypothetical protein BZZ01_06380 [Nostocales cyanobacterium HT-58-2]
MPVKSTHARGSVIDVLIYFSNSCCQAFYFWLFNRFVTEYTQYRKYLAMTISCAKAPAKVDFPEEVIGDWVGEQLERPKQGEYETTEPLF